MFVCISYVKKSLLAWADILFQFYYKRHSTSDVIMELDRTKSKNLTLESNWPSADKTFKHWLAI